MGAGGGAETTGLGGVESGITAQAQSNANALSADNRMKDASDLRISICS
ncbi:MAG: hypothetical protein AAFN04_05200 [Pseudomonadota bacterium]